MKPGHLSWVTRNRTGGDGLQLCQRRINLRIRKNFPTEKVVRHWNPREVVESSSLKGFKTHVGVTLKDVV